MSHRRPPTLADRYMRQVLALNPDMERLPEGQHDMDEPCVALVTTTCLMRSGNLARATDRESVAKLTTTGAMASPDMVSMYSRWRYAKHVYRFDRELSTALSRTRLPEDMGLDILHRLPYPIVYVDAPIRLGDGSEGDGKGGFFAWFDRRPEVGPAGEVVDTRDVVCVRRVVPAGDAVVSLRMDLDMGCDTFGEMVDSVMGEGLPLGRDDFSALASALINHLLYIISDGADQEVVYRPGGGGRRRGRATAESTIHDVGTRVGRALGEARVRYVASPGGVGTPKRTHVRAGHWQHYWVGRKSEPESRRVVLRWIDPLVVNPGGAPDGGTVVHDATG